MANHSKDGAAPLPGDARQLLGRMRKRGPRSRAALQSRMLKHVTQQSHEAAPGVSGAYASQLSPTTPQMNIQMQPNSVFDSNDELAPGSPVLASTGKILACNIRSVLSNGAELAFALETYGPEVGLLQETWLNKSIEQYAIPGYMCASRLDRNDGRAGGGICTYVRNGFRALVHVSNSSCAERSWHYLHTDLVVPYSSGTGTAHQAAETKE
jgi:hypothetical protein